jgi:hypothetical protein
MMRPHAGQPGFSLIETIIATMILSGAVLALGGIGNNILRESRLNRHYETAAAVLDKQLTLVDAVGIDQFIETDQTEGVYDEAEPGYRWKIETEYKNIDDLYLVTITVEWMEGIRPYRVAAQTLLDGTSVSRVPQNQSDQNPSGSSPAPGGPS